MTNRQISSAQTRAKLIRTAMVLFQTNGVENTSVSQITRAAGVAKGTFYTYFARKEDIVVATFCAPFAEIVDELAQMSGAAVTDKLSHYCRRFMECAECNGINVCRGWIQDVLSQINTHQNRDKCKWFNDVDVVQEILNVAIKNKELAKNTPVPLFAHMIISHLYGMMVCWCMSGGEFEPLVWVDKFSTTHLQKVLKDYLI